MSFELMPFVWWQWALAFGAAFFIGLAKTGIPGVGIFAVALFAMVIEPTQSVGLVLPLLILGDIVAVKTYHRHAIWSHLWRLMPWAVAGILIGFFTAHRLNPNATGKLIGAILVAMVVLHLWRKRVDDESIPDGIFFAAVMGLLAGFTTMIANAAGPIMIMYLLAMRLPKLAFIGTGAWYYFLLNSFKVPFQWDLGSITTASLWTNAALSPFVIGGALWGKAVLPKINQQLFENVALVFTVIAGVKLLFS